MLSACRVDSVPDTTMSGHGVSADLLQIGSGTPVGDRIPAVGGLIAARVTTYRSLALSCWLVNLGIGVAVLMAARGPIALRSTALDLSLVNVAIAVLIRDQRVMNLLYGLIGRCGGLPRPTGPRWTAAHQVGGLHLGAATAASAWFVLATAASITEVGDLPPTAIGVQVSLAVLLVIICLGASPWVRERHHDVFELTHRAGGWIGLGLLWALQILPTSERAGSAGLDGGIVLLAVITASVAAPWLQLRRVPVRARRLSDHALMLTLSYGVRPDVGATIAVSRHPLKQWHSFATVRLPDHDGYALLVSRAGDWTGRLIDDPPTALWVRGVPLTSFARLEGMYTRVVFVVTGSGIGPFLGQLLERRVPARLVWATRDPRTTYGDELVDALLRAQPDAVLWNTTELGRPDLPRLASGVAHDFGAEAVFVTSNRSTTAATVNRLQAEGFCAYGPIWDS